MHAQKPTHYYIEEQANLARKGSEAAARNATIQILQGVGVIPELANAFGFQERIVQAEVSYRKGNHGPIHESDIVKAVNNLASSLNAPAWAQTSLVEVRRIRMYSLPMYGSMFANTKPGPDGKVSLLSPDMSPLEGMHLALILIQQKLYNQNYQFSTKEKLALVNDRSGAVDRLYRERHMELRKAISSGTNGRSMRDMLSSADNFFNDLNLEPVRQQGVGK